MTFVEKLVATHRPMLIVDAVHATSPGSDLHTGVIVRSVANDVGCHAIIGLLSRREADLNRPRTPKNAAAIDAYREAMRELLSLGGVLQDGVLSRPVLHIAVHGMADRSDADVEIGTRHCESCAPEIRDFIESHLTDWAGALRAIRRRPIIAVDRRFIGDQSKAYHRHGDPETGYPGYGLDFHTVQIEWCHWLRDQHRDHIVAAISNLAYAFSAAL